MRTLDEQERLVLFLHYAAKSSPRLYRTLARMLPPLPETFELAARQAELTLLLEALQAIR